MYNMNHQNNSQKLNANDVLSKFIAINPNLVQNPNTSRMGTYYPKNQNLGNIYNNVPRSNSNLNNRMSNNSRSMKSPLEGYKNTSNLYPNNNSYDEFIKLLDDVNNNNLVVDKSGDNGLTNKQEPNNVDFPKYETDEEVKTRLEKQFPGTKFTIIPPHNPHETQNENVTQKSGNNTFDHDKAFFEAMKRDEEMNKKGSDFSKPIYPKFTTKSQQTHVFKNKDMREVNTMLQSYEKLYEKHSNTYFAAYFENEMANLRDYVQDLEDKFKMAIKCSNDSIERDRREKMEAELRKKEQYLRSVDEMLNSYNTETTNTEDTEHEYSNSSEYDDDEVRLDDVE